MKVRVNLGARSYDIVIGHNTLPEVGVFARSHSNGSRAVVITDHNAAVHARSAQQSLERAGFHAALLEIAPGEAQKSLAGAQNLYDLLQADRTDRQTLMVAVGGGVIGDLAGFVTATYLRGLALLTVPTTLLAMVDSSVGGKVGVNHPKGKNLIGAFHQPVGVWIDTNVLATLPEREYRSGLAEVVKYGVILDPDLFAFLEQHVGDILGRRPEAVHHVVARCCRLKADVVEKDEREEAGLRSILNYGHTFAHAIEADAGYGTWLHGEAVALGMMYAARLAESHGMIQSHLVERQRALLRAFDLPTVLGDMDADRLIEAMRSDKKSLDGRLRFILPRRPGEMTLVEDVSEQEIRRILEEIRASS
jgi:3-dehydroquinate synthase